MKLKAGLVDLLCVSQSVGAGAPYLNCFSYFCSPSKAVELTLCVPILWCQLTCCVEVYTAGECGACLGKSL